MARTEEKRIEALNNAEERKQVTQGPWLHEGHLTLLFLVALGFTVAILGP